MSFNARESGTSKSHPLAKIVRGRGRPVSRSFLKGIFQGIGRRIWSFAGFFAQEEARQGIGDFGGFRSLELQRLRQWHRRREGFGTGHEGYCCSTSIAPTSTSMSFGKWRRHWQCASADKNNRERSRKWSGSSLPRTPPELPAPI